MKRFEDLKNRVSKLENDGTLFMGGNWLSLSGAIRELESQIATTNLGITLLARVMGYESFSNPPKTGFRKIKNKERKER